MHPLIRSLDGALSVEHQLQRLAAYLQGRDDVSDSARELVERIHAAAGDHIAMLGRYAQTGIDLTARLGDSERALLENLPAPASVHLRELYGLVDQASLWYEAIVFSASAKGDTELSDCAVHLLEDCVLSLADLDVEVPSALLDELERAGESLSESVIDDCIDQIASAWEADTGEAEDDESLPDA